MWTKTRGVGNRGGRWGWLGWWGGVWGKGRKLYLNNNKIQKYLIKKLYIERLFLAYTNKFYVISYFSI